MYSALDFMLKTLITSSDFTSLANKNWDAIARLVPGTNAVQCANRYEELLTDGGDVAFQHVTQSLTNTPASNSGISLVDSESSGQFSNCSRPSSSKTKGSQDEKETPDSKSCQQNLDLAQNGPVMVIHVCDEAKDVKKDFHCPRDLLVQEMKYFAEYLSTDAQRWEEVDISVHCNVQIFDWLMKYVKRGTKEVAEEPSLEANNVISILISSDFLKMDSLVSKCISFCHKNMSSIVSTPCNMGCINDRLLTRISDLFNHNEADDVKDRKDKFKSKLFCKKIEKLFEPDHISSDSLENATTLFRCSICKRLLTQSNQRKIKCVPSRMTFDHSGSMTYSHILDSSFDVNEHILELKSQLKTWRDVYWRLWGTINWLTCDRCGECFPLTEFSHCRYHPEQAHYENEQGGFGSYTGVYPCCHQKTFRFDPTFINKGCEVREHLVKLPMFADEDISSKTLERRLYEDLLARKDVICMPHQYPLSTNLMQIDVFGNEAFACYTHTPDLHLPSLSAAADEGKQMIKPRLQALTMEKEVSYFIDDYGPESDDEMGDEETQGTSLASAGKKTNKGLKKSRVTVKPQAILLDTPEFEQTKKSIWDSQKSMRYNQDAQRQEDARRIKEVRLFLTKLRLTTEKVEKPKKEYAGGIYSRLENQWKANNPQFQGKQLQQPQFRSRLKQAGQIKSSLI